MSRINHDCGTCGHRGEMHDDKPGFTRCGCCRAQTFDPSGPVTRVDTFDGATGEVEGTHYAPGDRRRVGGAPHHVHACDGCVAVAKEIQARAAAALGRSERVAS